MMTKYLYILFFSFLLFISCADDRQDLFELLNLEEITSEELLQGYENGDFSIQQVTRAYLDRIEAIDHSGPGLNSVLAVNPNAMAIAEDLDRERAEGSLRGPLHGVPVLLKDNIDTYDMPTTAGSRFMEGSVPPKDAFIVQKLREQGAIILGKTNLSHCADPCTGYRFC